MAMKKVHNVLLRENCKFQKEYVQCNCFHLFFKYNLYKCLTEISRN